MTQEETDVFAHGGPFAPKRPGSLITDKPLDKRFAKMTFYASYMFGKADIHPMPDAGVLNALVRGELAVVVRRNRSHICVQLYRRKLAMPKHGETDLRLLTLAFGWK